MKKFKKHENEMAKLIDSNNRLSREVENKTQMLAAAEDCKRWAYDQLLKANQEIIRIERERRKSGSIYTVSKREMELERQLKSECLMSEELSEQLDTVSKRYEETQNAVTELMDENTMLKAKLEKAEEEAEKFKVLNDDAEKLCIKTRKEIGQIRAENERLEAEIAAMLLGAEGVQNDA